MRSRLGPFLLATATIFFATAGASSSLGYGSTDWPQFRGPHGNGVAVGTNLPDTWSASENVEWKAAVPGLGWSSPVVAGGRVFISTVLASNVEEPQPGLPTDDRGREVLTAGRIVQEQHEWRVYCFETTTGKPCGGWANGYTSIHTAIPEFSRHAKSTYANETPVVDANHVYVRIGDLGLWALGVADGAERWEVLTGHPDQDLQSWGSGSSPVLAGGNVIIAYDAQDGTWLAGFDTTDGTRRWRVARIQAGDIAKIDYRQERSTWASPYVWNSGSRTEVIVSDPNSIASYDPANGNRNWWLRGACVDEPGETYRCEKSWAAIPTPFAAGGLLYVSAGYWSGEPRPVYAIRPGASGDISLETGETSNDHVAWFNGDAGNWITSPLVHDGIFYNVKTRGYIEAYDAGTGTRIYRERLGAGVSFTASPWTYGDRIFTISESGDTYVIAPGREFSLVRVNPLDEMTMATPAVAGSRLLIRTRHSLYSITASLGPNLGPEAVGALADLNLVSGLAPRRVAVASAFSDPENDPLTYTADSSNPSVASVAASTSSVTVSPLSAGTATVTVTASDAAGSGLTAVQTFNVIVSNSGGGGGGGGGGGSPPPGGGNEPDDDPGSNPNPAPNPSPGPNSGPGDDEEPTPRRTSTCSDADPRLCLHDGLFRVSGTYTDAAGTQASRVVELEGKQPTDSGVLYFFSLDNWEVLVKVLNGCGENDHWWVFVASATTLDYAVAVQRGDDENDKKIYTRSSSNGVPSPATVDLQAFPCRPGD